MHKMFLLGFHLLIEIQSQRPDHPFQHLLYIPPHASARLQTASVELALRLDAARNDDAAEFSDGWSSKFDADIFRTTAELGVKAFEALDITVALEGGNIDTNEPITLNKGSTSFLSDNELRFGASAVYANAKWMFWDAEKFALSFSSGIMAPSRDSNLFMSTGAVSYSHRILAEAELFTGNFIGINAGFASSSGETVFQDHLKPSTVRFFSASYTVSLGNISVGGIYEVSSPLLRRVNSLDEWFSSVGFSLELRKNFYKSYFLTVARGLSHQSFDISISAGYMLRL